MKIDILNNANDFKLFCKLENKAFQCGEGCELCPLRRAYDVQTLCYDKNLPLQKAHEITIRKAISNEERHEIWKELNAFKKELNGK